MNTINNVFSWQRFMLTLREQLYSHGQSVLFAALSVGLVVFIYALLSFGSTIHATNFHTTLYALILFGGEFLLLKNAFYNIRDVKRSYLYLTLPASNLEKFLAKLLLTSLGYIVAITLLFELVSLLTLGFSMLLFKVSQPLFNPFTAEVLSYIEIYLFIHAIFFLGGVYFKRHVISKTVLSLAVIFLVVMSLFMLVSSIFVQSGEIYSLTVLAKLYVHIFANIILVLVLPFCWIVAYLRFQELEIV